MTGVGSRAEMRTDCSGEKEWRNRQVQKTTRGRRSSVEMSFAEGGGLRLPRAADAAEAPARLRETVLRHNNTPQSEHYFIVKECKKKGKTPAFFGGIQMQKFMAKYTVLTY